MLLADDPDIFAHTLTYLADAPLDVQLSFVCSPSSAVDIVWMEPGESKLLGIVWRMAWYIVYDICSIVSTSFFFSPVVRRKCRIVGLYSLRYVEYIERGRFCCSGRRRPKADLFLLTPLPFASTKNKPSVCTGGVVCADRTDRD